MQYSDSFSEVLFTETWIIKLSIPWLCALSITKEIGAFDKLLKIYSQITVVAILHPWFTMCWLVMKAIERFVRKQNKTKKKQYNYSVESRLIYNQITININK